MRTFGYHAFMAGHSKFKNIMYRKGAQDAKRAKLFTKLIREITVAAQSGMPDPDQNPRLRAAVITAKASNMAGDTIDRAIGDDFLQWRSDSKMAGQSIYWVTKV